MFTRRLLKSSKLLGIDIMPVQTRACGQQWHTATELGGISNNEPYMNGLENGGVGPI